VLLSDRDIQAEINAGRVIVDPYDKEMIQPSSIDVRLDRFFRVFENHRYPHIDPATEQLELTRMVEPEGDEPFILHPGEFVLGSSYESVTLPADIAARLEGKALAVDTEVPTTAGWRRMGDLQPGDLVFDETGLPCLVLAAMGILLGRPCRRVVFSDGSAVVADASHGWLTVTKAERRRGAPGAIRTTAQIEATVRCRDEWQHHVPLAAPVQYGRRGLPIDPYVLGVWPGDGTSTKAEITVGRQDEQVILGEIEAAGYAVWHATGPRAFRIGGTCPGRVGRVRDPLTGRYAGDRSLSSTLRVMGLLADKHVPESYLTAGVDQRLALLQGLMDSDGYIDVYGRCEFVSCREAIADAVVELAASLGLRPKKRKKRAVLNGIDCGPAFQVKFTPRLPVFRLPRKLARLKLDDHAHAFRSIVAVEPVESVPVRCIQVASASGLFLVGRTYIPTHNSSLGRLGLLTHSTAGFIDPGFTGHVTLELSNVATLPIKLWPGMKIGQMCFFRLSSPAEHPYGSAVYGSRYQGQRGPTPSRSYQNFHRTKI
jgi:deoxycytidine triphosphate deaminase